MNVPDEDPPDAVPDEDAPRAPAGTWASSDAEEPVEAARTAPDESSDRLVRPTRTSRDVGTSSSSLNVAPAALAPASASASPIPGSVVPARPRYLASVLMRQRDEHREPIWTKRGRATALLGGIASIAAVLGASAGGVDAIAIAVLGACVALAALAPIGEAQRSPVMAALALSALAVGAWARGDATGTSALLLSVSLASGLVLRSKRTRAWSARALVGAGMGLGAVWLIAGGVRSAIIERFDPSGLAPPIVTLGLILTLALTLLAFVDDHGPSNAGRIAGAAMAWALLEAGSHVWVAGSVGPSQAPALAAAALVPAAAIALAQVLGGQPQGAARPGSSGARKRGANGGSKSRDETPGSKSASRA